MKLKIFILFVLISPLAFAAPAITLTPTTFKNLPGWEQGDQLSSLQAFQKSCVWVLKKPQNTPFQNAQIVCAAALTSSPKNNAEARIFFEKYFTPELVSTENSSAHNNNGYSQRLDFWRGGSERVEGVYSTYMTDDERASNKAKSSSAKSIGLFTGYYIPTLEGSLQKQGAFQIPVYGRPKDLTTLTRNQQTNYGHWVNGSFQPYPPRAEIVSKGIDAPIVLWLKNPIDLFFLQVQGSGLIELQNGQLIQLAFDGKNGQPYTAIGKILIADHQISPQKISMQTIQAWLMAHPDRAQAIMNQNASYVFFKVKTEKIAPQGAIGVPLTPGRSLAVDNCFIPYGIPLWLSTTVPQNGKHQPFNQLLIAQDTGSAIQGPIRGDVFWGDGPAAEKTAGAMQSTGQYWMLVPNS